MKERITAKPASPPGILAELSVAQCLCVCSCGGIDQVPDPSGWARSADMPGDEAMVGPGPLFNDRPFGPVFMPQ